jgi:hypothetical protein
MHNTASIMQVDCGELDQHMESMRDGWTVEEILYHGFQLAGFTIHASSEKVSFRRCSYYCGE